MLRPPPFPISIDQLDRATLATALGTEVLGFRSTQIGADRGMLGEIFLLDIEYGSGGSGPDQIVAKFAALREGSLASAQRGGTHERELRCYDELLASTPVAAPAMFGAWYDPATAHFLLLQAAVAADDKVDQIVGLDVAQARLVLRQAARLHATWCNRPDLVELAWLPRLDSDQRRHNLSTVAAAGWDPLGALLGDELTDQERSLGAKFPTRLDAALCSVAAAADRAGLNTLIHSDLRTDNLLFAPDGASVELIDWQGAGVGPPAFDLAYFMSQCLDVETRRTHEGALLDFYCTELASLGVELSASDVRSGYGESMLYGLAIACAIPLISDPSQPRVKALAGTMARRSIEAMRDHDQLWSP